MAKKKGDYKIPFDQNGNQMDWADPNADGRSWGAHEWRDNYVFEDRLTYKEYGRGRSSATLTFSRENGQTVSMFLSDADVVIPKLMQGRIEGKFTFVKKGQNFGCCLVQ